jgi:hypothetical protein
MALRLVHVWLICSSGVAVSGGMHPGLWITRATRQATSHLQRQFCSFHYGIIRTLAMFAEAVA